jgi:putative tricarboxylic transport membrane protein
MYPLILAIAVIGSFAVSGSLFDVASCIGFGVIGWIFKRYGFPVAPIVLGIVLGKMVEENFRRAVMMGGYSVFYTDKLAFVVLLISFFSFVWPLYKSWKHHHRNER